MRKIFSLFAAMLVAFVANAAVINIDNTTADALRTALNSAADGDEIVMAAGTYVESNSNYIAFDGKAVTVKAAEDANVIIQPQVPITVSNGGHAIFENVKIDASHLTELADWYEHLFYVTDENPNGCTFRGCELYGFNLNKSMFYCNTANKVAAMKFENCYFHDIMKSIIFIENTAGKPMVSVKNCTFENIIAPAVESYYAGIIDVRATEATLTVDHCTFYNVIPMNTDYSCVSKITLAKGKVTNCIFMLPTAQDGIRAMRGVTATNCITFNYLKDSGTGIHSSVTQNNCIQADPLFVDAANGNFTLGEGSPALTMNDGEPIGDPRWVPSDEPVEPLMKTIYCKMDKDWWKADGAAVGCHTWNDGGDPKAAWPGERMTPVEGETDIWSIELDINTYHMCIFTRVNGEGDIADWGAKTADLTIPTDENDMFTITNDDPTWGDPGCIGAWSKYEPSAPVVDEWAEITFAEAVAADDIAEEASYTVPGTEFALTLHDSGNKMAIDGNDCRFGTAEAYTMYNFRIKSGGASSSTKNYFTLNIPEAGTLRIAPRTGSNSATDRALVIAQGETELYNAVVQESQAIDVQEGENTVKVYPYVDVNVAAGEVRVSYTAGMNFYAFAFKAAGGDEPQPQECDWDAIDFLGDGSTEQTHSNQFKVCKVGEQPNVVNIQTPGFAAETGIYVTFPSAVFGEISLAEGQYVIEGAGIVLYLSAFTQEYTEVTVNWDGNDIVFTVYNAAAAPQPVEHTYTVAGGSADLFGTTWDPANTANDMTKLEDGTYKWEKTEVTLPAGNVEFKVVEDHAWTVCYPAENYQLVIPEAGVYTITITYNPEGNVVAGDAVKTGDAVVDPVVSIAGSMNSWNASADVMVLAEDKATASLTLNLAAQTYEFKVVINGGDWRSNAQEFTRENAVAAEMTGNLDNMHLVADIAGDYIFTWTFETNTLSIAFPIGDGIDNTAVENKAIKRIVNGQLFIEMNGVLYNAQGTIVR